MGDLHAQRGAPGRVPKCAAPDRLRRNIPPAADDDTVAGGSRDPALAAGSRARPRRHHAHAGCESVVIGLGGDVPVWEVGLGRGSYSWYGW